MHDLRERKRKTNEGKNKLFDDKQKNVHNHHRHQFMIAVLSLVCYMNSLGCDLVFDDVPAIVDNQDIRPESPWTNMFHNDFWGTPIQKEESHKSYRPLCVLTFRLNYLLHGLKPLGYHLVNVLLHAIVCVLYYRLCLQLLPAQPSLVASLLFAVHPIHTEAVTGVVGRAELLSSVFFLLALFTYISFVKSGTFLQIGSICQYFLLVALAMLSKEQGITVGGICLLCDIFLMLEMKVKRRLRDKSSRGKTKAPTPTWRKDLILRLLILLTGLILLLFLRMKIMGSKVPVFNKFDNPASNAPALYRRLTYNYVMALDVWLLLFPLDLCCDWTMGTVPVISSIGDFRNFATVLLYLSLYVLLFRGFRDDTLRMKRILMGLGLMGITFLPASNLLFPVGFVIAERVLYLPSMGFCFFVACGWHLIFCAVGNRQWLKIVLWICIINLLCLNAVKTIKRNFDWRNEETLYKAGLQVTTQNAKLWNNLGHLFDSRGEYQRALEYFLKAIEVQPDDIGGHLNAGTAYSKLGDTQEAEKAFWKAKSLFPKVQAGQRYTAHVVPRHLEVFRHLGSLLSKNESRLEEAQELYREATSMKQDYTEAYLDRAGILIKLNRSKEAREAYSQALRHERFNPDIFYNIGVLLLEEGKTSQALGYFDKALQVDPEHEKSLINYAILTQESGDAKLRRLAHERLQMLLDKGNLPPERIYFNMGMLAMEDKEWAMAESYFARAIQCRSNFTSALFNMALLLHNMKRPLEAVPYLQTLLKLQEFHLKGLMLLANIYFSDMNDYQAAKDCYESIIRQDPTHVPALHNLCAVHVQMNELKMAENCLLKALEFAPNEGYIIDHLKLVREYMEKEKRIQSRSELNKNSIGDHNGSKSFCKESDCRDSSSIKT